MRTERDRARSLVDVFVGPRCKGVGRSCPSIVFASKPTPVSTCLPWDSPSETVWALWGGETIVRAVTVSLRGTLVSTWVIFSGVCLSKCPSASIETSVRSKKTSVRSKKTSVRSKKKKKQKNSKKVRRRMERRRQQQEEESSKEPV